MRSDKQFSPGQTKRTEGKREDNNKSLSINVDSKGGGLPRAEPSAVRGEREAEKHDVSRKYKVEGATRRSEEERYAMGSNANGFAQDGTAEGGEASPASAISFHRIKFDVPHGIE